jgi:antitoxin PrlF
MSTATLTSEGKTTIPQNIRQAVGLKPGDQMHFSVMSDRTIIVRIKNRTLRSIAVPAPGSQCRINSRSQRY